MKSGWLVLMAVISPVWAQDMPVYYDYFENGKLTGGRILIDPGDPVHRSAFGLDGAVPRGTWTVTTIVDNGPATNRIDIVILGDGYTESDLGLYANQVDNMLSAFFAEEPLAAYASYFNVHRVDVISNESGVDEHDSGIFRDTALDMAYDCAGIPRLLCINLAQAADAASAAPEVDQTLALANSTGYGGAAYPNSNLGTLGGGNSQAVEIALHEFGHCFADLADEYDYADGTMHSGAELLEPNVSIYDPAEQASQRRKWYGWLDLPNVDAFEGAAYYEFGIYRPSFNSLMRSLNRPFQPVNVEQFVISMYKSVSPIDDATPPSVAPLPACTTFFVTPLQPLDQTLSVQWSLAGADVPDANGTTFTPDWDLLDVGIHDVVVRVVDDTPRVRNEMARDALMTATRQWQIKIPGPYGDVYPEGGNNVVDIQDVTCALLGFADHGGCPHADIFPCDGNGVIDIDDLVAILDVVGGDAFCPGPCG